MIFFRGALWLSACGLAFFLAGCANPGAAPGGTLASAGKTDPVTESDEPEVRRRARLRLELASGYFEHGQPTIALDELKQALVIDPTYSNAYNLRGLVYLRLNDQALAEDSFRRALALDPRDADAAHNYGWQLCQLGRYQESVQQFGLAIANPSYTGVAKTLMTQGICQQRAGQRDEALQSLMRSYEIDAGNPFTGYNLARLLYERDELTRAQFYIRRLNNSEQARAETLWLGAKIERRLGNREASQQLGDQLTRRYGQSREAGLYEKGLFNE